MKFIERNKRRKLSKENRMGKETETRKEKFFRENHTKEKSVVNWKK